MMMMVHIAFLPLCQVACLCRSAIPVLGLDGGEHFSQFYTMENSPLNRRLGWHRGQSRCDGGEMNPSAPAAN
jgi:hypothetical protein